MSVIVRGMRMPENCDVCRFVDWSNLHQTACCKLKDYEPCFSDYSQEYRAKRSTICPLVDLGKHGDLIDADELAETAEYYETVLDIRHYAKTVIEAEDGT